MAQTQEQYYGDDTLYGKYQYVSISEVLDSIMLEVEADSDHFLNGMPRFLLRKYAYAGVKEFNKGAAAEVVALELTIGNDLKFILPQDYVDYVRISRVDSKGKLRVLDMNPKMNIAKTYLQDNEYQILFDEDGHALEADGSNALNVPLLTYDIDSNDAEAYRTVNTDTSEISRYGQFNIDKRRGVIAFTSNLLNWDVVLEYVSDGLNLKAFESEEVTVHKILRKALEDYIYYEAIARKRTVPANEKERARRASRSSRHAAIVKLADINVSRVAKVMRGAFKPIKT